MFCGRRCRDRARSLPPHLKTELLRRSSQYAITATKLEATRYQTEMVENAGALNQETFGRIGGGIGETVGFGNTVEFSNTVGISPSTKLTEKEIRDLRATAAEHKMRQTSRATTTEKTSGVLTDSIDSINSIKSTDSIDYDPEMIKFRDTITDSIEIERRRSFKTKKGEVKIDIDDSLSDPNDDGLRNKQQGKQTRQTQQTKQTQQAQPTQSKKRVFGKGIK